MTIRINLLATRELRALRRKRRTIIAGAAALCLAAVTLAAGNVLQLRRQAALEAELAEQRTLVAGLRRETGAVKAVEERIQRQRQRNQAVESRLQRGGRYPRILRGLASAAPERLWLTRYADSRDTAILEGRATDDESIARFLRDLAAVFEVRQLVEAGKVQGDQDLRRFVIHAGKGAPGAPPDSVPSGRPRG